MNDDKNTARDLTAMAFSFLSGKVKLIIIGIILGLFFLILLPVIAIMSLGSGGGDEEIDSSSASQVENVATSEVIGSDKLYQYANSKFAMPFETWNTEKDVITSKFSKSRTITVNGVTQTKAHTRYRFSCCFYIKSSYMCGFRWKSSCKQSRNNRIWKLCCY